MSTTGRPAVLALVRHSYGVHPVRRVLRPPWSLRAHLPHPYPIPLSSHPLLCSGREIGGRVPTVSIRCTAESSAIRRTSIVDSGSRPEPRSSFTGRAVDLSSPAACPSLRARPAAGRTSGATGFISYYRPQRSVRGSISEHVAVCYGPVLFRLGFALGSQSDITQQLLVLVF